MSPRHQEALAHLLYGINVGGGFVALTGEVGTGKTTLCHCLLEQLPEDVDVALILNPKLNAVELLANICDELGIRYSDDCCSLKTYTDLLNEYLLSAHSRGRRTVLLIDEAQNLSLEVLEQIRLLTNLETTESRLLQIILIGQPELKLLLEKPELRQLNQRITARYHLEPLSLSETQAYIHHRLSVSGGDPALFNKSVVKKIYHSSQGIPRLINIVCDRSLLGAYASGNRKITTRMVKKAAEEVLSSFAKRPFLIPANLWLMLIVFGVCGAGLYYFGIPLLQRVNPTTRSATHSTALEPVDKITTVIDQASTLPETVIEKPSTIEKASPVFSEIIQDYTVSLDAALLQLLTLWKAEVPAGIQPDCQTIKNIGLRCLASHGNWNEMLNYNRPAVLEFSLGGEGKRYASLVALEENRPVLQLGEQKYSFHLEEILPFWRGYYLLLWEPPHPKLSYIRPGRSSPEVLWLRQKLAAFDNTSVNAQRPNLFDDTLKSRVINFQRSYRLTEDGVVGPRTIIHLKNTSKAVNFPKLNPSH